jgi:hypothetical protein
MAIVCVFAGCIFVTLTVAIMIFSHWDRDAVVYAKWTGFIVGEDLQLTSCRPVFKAPNEMLLTCRIFYFSVNLYCMAAVLFPIGFTISEIGGSVYQLPNSYQVGLSYIMFVMALWIAVISELFASRIQSARADFPRDERNLNTSLAKSTIKYHGTLQETVTL